MTVIGWGAACLVVCVGEGRSVWYYVGYLVYSLFCFIYKAQQLLDQQDQCSAPALTTEL